MHDYNNYHALCNSTTVTFWLRTASHPALRFTLRNVWRIVRQSSANVAALAHVRQSVKAIRFTSTPFVRSGPVTLKTISSLPGGGSFGRASLATASPSDTPSVFQILSYAHAESRFTIITNETAADWTATEETEIARIMASEKVERIEAIRLMRSTRATRLVTLETKRKKLGTLAGIDALDYIRLRRGAR
jgi:hypothetical protein